MNTPALREAYEQSLGMLSDYSTWLGQHEGLFRAWQALKDGPAWATLDEPQRRTVDNALRDFRLAGVDLPADKKQRYGEIQARLSSLANTFSNQLLDATQAWHLALDDDSDWPACRKALWRPWRPTPRPRAEGLSHHPGFPQLPAGDDIRRRP